MSTLSSASSTRPADARGDVSRRTMSAASAGSQPIASFADAVIDSATQSSEAAFHSAPDARYRAAWADTRTYELTALRGIAALMVVLHHARTEWHPIFASGERYSMVVALSALWVHFFFVLSGVVMMHAYGAAFQQRVTTESYGRFVLIRFGRIYPLHLLALTLCVIAVYAKLTIFHREPFSLVASILLIQGFTYEKLVWNYPAWSISTEWYVYLVFPFMALVMMRLRRASLRWTWLIAVLTCSSIATLFSSAGGEAIWRIVFCFGEFTLGCVIYLLVDRRALRRFSSPMALCLVLLPLLLMALPIAFDSANLHAAIVLGFGVAIAVLCNQETVLRPLLNSRLLQFLGVISYSVYLLHPVLFRLAQAVADALSGKRYFIASLESMNALLLFMPYMLLLVAASWISYRFVEEPARRAFKSRARAVPSSGAVVPGINQLGA